MNEAIHNLPALIDNKAGAYRILPGGSVFCAGVLPYDSFEVVRVLLRPWIALEQAYGTTQIALFHVADIPNLWGPTLLGTFGEAVRRGVLVYHARPPLVGAEVELEARAVRQELIVATN